MARNVEIKARVADIEALAVRVARIANEGPVRIDQDDTFFHCETGRLKLRQFSPADGELIFYRRADDAGPRESFYLRSPTSDPGMLRESLTLAYGEAGRVRKQRTLYRVGRTRVHLDSVDGLGTFVELEVVLDDGEACERAMDEARELMDVLGVPADDLVASAYVDLLETRAAAGATTTRHVGWTSPADRR